MLHKGTKPEFVNSFPQTIGQAIELNGAANPQAPAIVFPNCATLSYGALLQHVEQFGLELRRVGIGASKRVAVALSDGPGLAIATTAISCHAAVVPLDPRLTQIETEDLFVTHGIDALVMADDTSATARDVAVRHGATLLEASQREDELGLTLRAAGPERATEDNSVGPDNLAIILRTSGTTGRSKLVPVTHGNLLALAGRLQGWFDLGASDRLLCVMPLHYSQGLTMLFATLILGGSGACPSRAAGFDFFNWLADLKPTWYSAGPTIHHSVVDAGEALEEAKFSHSLRFINSAAAPLPDATRARLESLFGVPVIDSYGLSEGGLIAANSVAPERRKRGTVGTFRHGELAIRSEDGTIADRGGPAEIVLRGLAVTPGYLDDPEANRAAFKDGWFRTGDLGRIDDDGFLTLCGRTKEIINRGGEKVSPAEIDAALLRHPAVVEAAGFPVSHARLGEDVAAAVVVKPGSTVTPQELRHFLQPILSDFKLPRRIHFVASMPKGKTGKIQRRELSQLFGTLPNEHAKSEWNSSLEVQIAGIWQRLLSREVIGPEDDFFELGGDSLLATQMLLELERLTGRVLPGSILFDNATIRQLAESVVHKDDTDHQGLLIKLQTGTDTTPFIFIDGDFAGGGYYVRNLMRHLGPKWPIYSLRSHVLLGNYIPSIEQIAQDYKKMLDAAGISGPVRLGGHCNGALIALELAHQLEAEGRKVELIAMVEPISFNARLDMRIVARTLETVLGLVARDADARQAKMQAAMSSIWRNATTMMQQYQSRWLVARLFLWWATDKAIRALRAGRTGPTAYDSNRELAGNVENQDRRLTAEEIDEIYFKRMAGYIPRPVKGLLLSIVTESNVKSTQFSGEAWCNFSPQTDIVIVPGAHLTCITTHVEGLANQLRKHLAALD